MGTSVKSKHALKLCMFCGKDKSFGKMSREHFVPKGLWSGRRPDRTVTLPAHVSCTAAFAEDNEYFRDVLAMDAFAVNHPEAKQIVEGELKRKIETHFGSIAKTMRGAAVRPIFTPSGLYIGNHPTFKVDSDRIDRVLRNVVKGIFYRVTGRPVLATTEILILNQDVLKVDAYQSLVPRMRPWTGFGDDVFGCRFVTDNTYPDVMVCSIQFYRRFLFVGHTVEHNLVLVSNDRMKYIRDAAGNDLKPEDWEQPL
jgi:hypothetical protein